MSEASAHKLSYVAETTRGTTPTNPKFKHLPDTRTTLNLQKETLATERLTGTRFPAEPRTGARTVSGDIPVDLSTGAYDDFIASALQGDWSVSIGEDKFNITVGGTPTNDVIEGQTFNTTNGVVTVESIDAKEQEVVLTYDPTGAGSTTTHEIFGTNSKTIDSTVFAVVSYADFAEDSTTKAGNTRKSFSILREFSDFAPGQEKFLLYTGCEVATWNLSAAANGIAKSTFTFFGRDMVGPSLEAPTGVVYLPAEDTQPFDTFSGSMEIDGVAKCIVTDYSLTINNGHAPRFTVGCPASQDPMVGQSVVEGSITAYFEDATLYKKFVNEQSFSLKLTLADSKGNQMIVDLPNLKIGSGTQPDVTGDGSIPISINFTAHKDNTLESHVSVRRLQPLAV